MFKMYILTHLCVNCDVKMFSEYQNAGLLVVCLYRWLVDFPLITY